MPDPASPAPGGAGGCQVVKLGGGLITSLGAGPDFRPALDHALVTDRAREIADHGVPTVLVHGTGAFGKPHARTHGYLGGRLPAGRQAVVSTVTTLLARMELELLECVRDAGLHPLRLPVGCLADQTDGRIAFHGADQVRRLLDHGFTPVLGGNFVWGDDGFGVYSSDGVAVDVAVALRARCLVMATRAPGVQRRFGETDDIFDALDVDDDALVGSIDPTVGDVTGGMRGKLTDCARAVRAGIPTYIVDGRPPGNLAAGLAGHPRSGTRLYAGATVGT